MRTVAVIAGGPSSEHDVSRWSGERVLESLDRRRFRPLLALVERDGTWSVEGVRRGGPLEALRALRDEFGCEVCFLALHGPFGEDGTIQGFLETVGMPYTGSGVAGSALAADKIRAKRLVAAAGVAVAPDRVVPPASRAAVAELGWPVFVKDPFGGSTLEVRRARDADELEDAIAALRPGCDRLLVEAGVFGREMTVGVLDDPHGVPQALPVAEIRPRGEFFDYENKYTEGVAEEIVPAPLALAVTKRLQEAALAAHEALGLRGMSRNDFILKPDDVPVYLESNSIPGLAPTSLLPQAAAAAGITFPALLTRLIEGALRRPGPARVPSGKLAKS